MRAMIKRLLISIVFPLLMLLAQQQLFAHELSHLDQTSSSQDQHHAPQHDFCSKCAHGSEFGHGLLSDIQPFYAFVSSTETVVFHAIPYYRLLATHFSARAPPSIL